MQARVFLISLLLVPHVRAEPAETSEQDARGETSDAPASAVPGDAGPVALEAPVLEHFVEAPYPMAAINARVEGTVLLELVLSSEGTVTSAEVVEGPGFGLNEAARDAAVGFRFRPARKDGEARAARIRYAYEFHLPALDEAPPPQGAIAPPIEAQHVENQPQKEATSGVVSSAPEMTVEVQGQREADRLRRSAHAVTVVELGEARKESADLGEVLARTEGVNVQRSGGLGSRARFTLGGFDDHQVRFFLDGIPLEYSGYSFGIQNVPLNFADRVEVYKGVVPVRLGADSLGGAFDVVTDRATRGTKSALSFQAGSFGTYRLAASGRHLNEKTGLFGKAEAFYDVAENDYQVDVEVTDESADLVPARVHRMHDEYRGVGGNLEVGVVDRIWAQRLLVRVFATDYAKELQHNVQMTEPYGEATYGGFSTGGNVRYEHSFGQGLTGSFVTGYAFDRTDFLDITECIYDWYHRCIFERRIPGEVGERPSDRSLWDHTAYGRWNLAWRISSEHALRYAIAPTFFTRTGEERRTSSPTARDPLQAQREMFKWINGLEYEANAFDARLQNLAFGKAYLQASQSQEHLGGGVDVQRNVQRVDFGAGNGLRYEFSDWAFGKVSYEYAIRLPEPVEMFGNGVQIADNLLLEPERSHNVNLSFLVDGFRGELGRFDGSFTAFYRGADDLIVLLGRDAVFRYENVYAARALGLESALSWISPGEHIELGVNGTYQDVRNLSGEGTFSQFEGDRIPNKPYFVVNGHVRLEERGAFTPRDEIALTWYARYVHEFFRSWESVGMVEKKPLVPAQFTQTVVLSYLVTSLTGQELSLSLEVQNLTDERTFDFYGVQRPGRAFYAKATATF